MAISALPADYKPSPSDSNLNTIKDKETKEYVADWMMNHFLQPMRLRTDELIAEIDKELKD